MTSVTDLFPTLLRRPGRREMLLLIYCFFCFCIGLVFITEVRETLVSKRRYYTERTVTSKARHLLEDKINSFLWLSAITTLQGGVYVLLIFDYYACNGACQLFIAVSMSLTMAWVFGESTVSLTKPNTTKPNKNCIHQIPIWRALQMG